ncbi:MAG TPA: HNH endonuclease signature motif containing protein, partial [Gemmataceae bacterium]|nr:HNH endonuclease signature motif containing protein [Gemmataceae bacterium]
MKGTTRYFAQLWRKDTYQRQEGMRASDPLMHHTGGTKFRKRVTLGDFIYVWSLIDHKIYVVGRMQIGRLGSQEDADKLYERGAWKAPEHVFAQRGTETPLRFDLTIPSKSINQIRFLNVKGEQTDLKYNSAGRLEPQCFRGLRELTPQTARLLDSILGDLTPLDANVSLPGKGEDDDSVNALMPPPEQQLAEDLITIAKRKGIESTTKEALINARVGQGLFREHVLQLWGNCCAVTRSLTLYAIRASHIKPWRESTDDERLDPHNGLPLVASLDALFDAGLISFESSGKMVVSSKLKTAERRIFAIGKES